MGIDLPLHLYSGPLWHSHRIHNSEVIPMAKRLSTLPLLCAGPLIPVTALAATNDDDNPAALSTQPVNPAIEWNRTLLSIVRTPGAQPPTIHSTRNFAILHVAIFDAVNNIDRTFKPYAVRLSHVSRKASAQAAADQAAHDVLISIYPSFAASLDSELQQDLEQIPHGRDKADGIEVGQAVAAAILALRRGDGSAVTLPPLVPTTQPGSYQLPPPHLAPADFIQWANVTPFSLAHANEFRPEPPPELPSDEYTRSFF